jgi:hypothetical protein
MRRAPAPPPSLRLSDVGSRAALRRELAVTAGLVATGTLLFVTAVAWLPAP